MSNNINRRDLFKFTGGAAVGLALAGARVSSGLAAEPDERPDGIISLSGNENSYGPSQRPGRQSMRSKAEPIAMAMPSNWSSSTKSLRRRA